MRCVYKDDDGNAIYVEKVLDGRHYIPLLRQLQLVEKPTFTMFGRTCTMHRDIGFYTLNPSITEYKYSGQSMPAQLAPQWMHNLTISVNTMLGTNFNAILVNKYNNGQDYIAYHSDDEKEIDHNIGVASISFGVGRQFRIKHKDTGDVYTHIHNDGELLIMYGTNFQTTYKHTIPKELKVKDTRWSLTFRSHKLA